MDKRFPVYISTMKLTMPRLEIYYPVVSGLNNINVQKNINSNILNLVYQMIKDQGYYENPQTTITGYYEIKTNERGILSIVLTNYAFSGGAHGLTIMKSLTFDVETGKLYSLKDLFKDGSNYVDVLSEIIEEQIEERDIPLITEFDKIRPDQDFYIADKALVIYFQLYELAPYAYGFPQFPISVYEIQDIIKEDGPLGEMLY
ncbi:DUF3298 and DUF4163 domain-containing protein [Alkaliphilus sp. MSJ-5]|uniref:DUF3298 and DUF4163 domain-containing protein n=1 Tax=Alkaliphilus flagellatus TaxID=2841507 RepID=A0ABS6G401_9FIRM|nr:DUF3298 and DUF4163 domain-containing protein [Alkaliphilus flagellatus]MBU5677212.1 DUF3298 and DUF4163 domain-containing protein [Alkaliphilus flagellatus]